MSRGQEENPFAPLGKVADHLKGHKLQRKAANLAFKPMLRLALLAKGHPRILRDLKNPGAGQGLLEGSILGGRLAYPDEETGGGLLHTQAEAGQWLGYDFRRPTEFPQSRNQKEPPRQLFEGKLFGIMLDEIMGNDANQKTPNSLLRITDLEHVLRFAAPSIDTLVDNEFLVPTTYQQAYQQVGVYERYAADLSQRGLTDQPLHAVTPKGNTLIFLMPAFGAPSPKSEPQTAADLEFMPGLRPA